MTVIDTTNGRDITVTYHDGDIIAGEGGKAGDQFTIRDALASRDDLVFVGWSETSDGTVKYIPGQKPVFNEDTDLFAVWREDSGTITEFSKQLVGTKDEIPSTVTAAGIAFPGTDGVVTIPNGGSVTLLYKITVIGTAGLDYEVTDTGAVHIGGDDLKGTVPVDGTAVIYVTRTFKAGNIDDNGNVKNTASVTPGKGAEETTSSTVTTPAMEVPPITYNYALTYDGNKPDSTTGTVTNVPAAQTEKTATESWETSITDAVPELEGYTFKGWSESASGEKDYEAGDKVTLTASSPEKNLYAVWEKNEPVDDPSLGVTKTVDKEKPSVGERFVYTTEVTNPEDEDIVVTIVDALDDALIFQTASGNGTYDEGTHTVTWNDVTIPKEGSATVSLVVKAKSIGEIYDETKVYRDGKPTSVGATVNPTDPQLVATKSNNNVKVNQETGEATVDYTVTVTNTSGHSLYGLRLTDVLDEPTVIKLNEASTGTPSVKVTFDNFMVRKADMYTFQPMETMEGGWMNSVIPCSSWPEMRNF